MTPPIFWITAQSCLIGAVSNLIAQAIRMHRDQAGLTFDWLNFSRFLLLTAITTPPNYLWQCALEAALPTSRHRIALTPTLAKLAIDQSVGAALNTIAYSYILARLRGASSFTATEIAYNEFWPLIIAGWSFWPFVSAASYFGFSSVPARTRFASLAGLIWGVYLSLVTN